VSVTDILRTGHDTTFWIARYQVTGPAGAFDLITTCCVYALPRQRNGISGIYHHWRRAYAFTNESLCE